MVENCFGAAPSYDPAEPKLGSAASAVSTVEINIMIRLPIYGTETRKTMRVPAKRVCKLLAMYDRPGSRDAFRPCLLQIHSLYQGI